MTDPENNPPPFNVHPVGGSTKADLPAPEWKPNPTDDLPMGSLQDQLRRAPPGSKPAAPWFKRGDYVRKRSGSAWQGFVCGEYSTSLTHEGYAVESEFHHGSVQIYPATALELVPPGTQIKRQIGSE